MIHLNKPKFWQQFDWLTLCLLPLSYIYRFITYLKYIISKPIRINIPVICVGNIVVGGAGKTPTVITIAKFLQQNYGKKVAIVLRGYKGSLSTKDEATLVQKKHSANEVGDEALLLSKIAPVYINKDRFLAALCAQKDGAEVIIMDDGLQNYTLKQDFSILVIDSNYGLGNHQLLPAGALRESLGLALKKSDCVVYTGEGKKTIHTKLPTFTAKTIVKNNEQLQNKTFIALCGIASPEKFFATLQFLNITLAEKFIFGDHHNYSHKEIEVIVELAKNLKLKIITTSKDIVKIPPIYHQFIEIVEIEYILPIEFYNLILKIVNKSN